MRKGKDYLMNDFTELLKNQVFNEDANGFEPRAMEKLSINGSASQKIKTGAVVQTNGDILFLL